MPNQGITLADTHGMIVPEHSMTQALATDPHCYMLCKNAPLYPDQAVFLGPRLPLVDGGQSVEDVIQHCIETTGNTPKVLVIENKGVLIASEQTAAIEAMLGGHLELLRRLPSSAPLRTLSDLELSALLNWEPERYRQSLVK